MAFLNLLYSLQSYSLPQISFAAALLGFTSHVAYFVRSERDSEVLAYFLTLVLLPPGLLLATYLTDDARDLYKAVSVAVTVVVSYLSALSTSIVLYRLFLHPLRKFPGPLAAKITKLYFPWMWFRTGGQAHIASLKLHQKYGDVVRIGPNELSVVRPELVSVLSTAAKGPWYLLGYPKPSVQLTRDPRTHSIRRRVWDKAFSNKAQDNYIPRVLRYSSQLHDEILQSAKASRSLNMTAWFNFLTFDTMGDLTFGKPFGLLSSGGSNNTDYFMNLTHKSMNVVGSLGMTPWIINLIERLRFGGNEHRHFLAWCGEMVNARIKNPPEIPDIFSHFLDAEDSNKAPYDCPLQGEARTAIVAGSDTTASTLANMFLYLAADPSKLAPLRAELDPLFDAEPNGQIPNRIISGSPELPVLEAYISESLRMNPAVPGGVQRVLPADGAVLDDGTRLPGGVNAIMPLYTSFRDERWFPKADQFLPERWLNEVPEKLSVMKTVFHPFWVGRYQCVGKSLALMQLRVTLARLVRAFDVQLEEGYSVESVLEGAKDTFTLEMPPLFLNFRERRLV